MICKEMLMGNKEDEVEMCIINGSMEDEIILEMNGGSDILDKKKLS
jgi:hypothetical protein